MLVRRRRMNNNIAKTERENELILHFKCDLASQVDQNNIWLKIILILKVILLILNTFFTRKSF